MYRAHLTVYGTTIGSDITRLSAHMIAESFNPKAIGDRVGTRHGHPGVWVERNTAESFRRAIDKIVRFAIETGYAFEIGCTNAQSKVQADTATFSQHGRRAREMRLVRTARA